jgi:two-component system, NarL family, response regulator LiaR
MAKSPIRVMLIDDDLRIHKMVAELISAAEDVSLVGQLTDGTLAIDTYAFLMPDVVLVDILMPIVDGIIVTQSLVGRFPEARIVAISSYSDHAKVWSMLRNGAIGYVLKDALFDELVSTIRSVYRGSAVFSAQVAEVLRRGEAVSAQEYHLTEREMEVLKLCAEGLNHQEIGERLQISVFTVRFHLKNLLEKMGVETRSAALVLAAKANLI